MGSESSSYKTNETRIKDAIRYNNIVELRKFIKRQNVNEFPFHGEYYGQNFLHYACRHGNINIVKYLINENANVNVPTRSPLEYSALHIAVSKCDLNKVKLLCEHNADINFKDLEGDTPLHYALDNRPSVYDNEERVLEMVQYLVNKGANIYAKNNEGVTPIYNALAEFRSIEIAKYLLRQVDILESHEVLGDCKESLRDLVGKLHTNDSELYRIIRELE